MMVEALEYEFFSIQQCLEKDLPAIWNETRVSLVNRVAWFQARRAQGYPTLVAVDDQDRVLGYTSFGHWRPFEDYRFTVEHSVYVAE